MRALKTVAVAAALLIGTAAAADAQVREIGFKLGANLANIENAEVVSPDARTAFTGGGFLRFGFPFGLTLQPEVMYSPKGADRPDQDAPGFPNSIELEYVDIPVLLRYDFPFQPFRPYLLAGPYAAFEVDCQLGDAAGQPEFDCDDDRALGPERRKVDFGVIAGGGLAFGMMGGSLLLEARYGIGMQDLYKNETETDFPFEDIENRFASLLVGYSVPLGGRRF